MAAAMAAFAIELPGLLGSYEAMVAAPAKPCVRLDLATCAAECRPTTCPISWASTPANCPSEVRFFNSPCVMNTWPPGRANALIVWSSASK